MPKINIPVTWTVWGIVSVNYKIGDTIGQITERALNAPLPDGEYVVDSLQPDIEAISSHNDDQIRKDFPRLIEYDDPS